MYGIYSVAASINVHRFRLVLRLSALADGAKSTSSVRGRAAQHKRGGELYCGDPSRDVPEQSATYEVHVDSGSCATVVGLWVLFDMPVTLKLLAIISSVIDRHAARINAHTEGSVAHFIFPLGVMPCCQLYCCLNAVLKGRFTTTPEAAEASSYHWDNKKIAVFSSTIPSATAGRLKLIFAFRSARSLISHFRSSLENFGWSRDFPQRVILQRHSALQRVLWNHTTKRVMRTAARGDWHLLIGPRSLGLGSCWSVATSWRAAATIRYKIMRGPAGRCQCHYYRAGSLHNSRPVLIKHADRCESRQCVESIRNEIDIVATRYSHEARQLGHAPAVGGGGDLAVWNNPEVLMFSTKSSLAIRCIAPIAADSLGARFEMTQQVNLLGQPECTNVVLRS
ncbi:hypothetical protein PR048_026383 [Dryococelus australis]|uniref:Uncharacterized protein n=1 Tax=Dryococelus australis TaxID=614101 RepID=A0ABQ9GL90_9NEOP|nr:hypothetical protein PR048_026383 [Dryococelus australis]